MTIRLACSPGEIRVAATEGDTLLDYAIWRPGRPDGVGDVHRGRVSAVVPGMAGAFVSLGGGLEGFLPDSAGAAGRTVGDGIAVQILRAAQGGKGPRLRAVPEQPGAGPPTLLRRGPDPVRRLAERHAGPVVIDDPAVFAALRPAFGERAVLGEAWDEAVHAAVAGLESPGVALPGGLRATVEPTAALVAIDIDMAGATAGREAKQASQMAANRAILPALAAQIRLRNLSGAILIDFAGLPIRRRATLSEPLAAALAGDPARPRLLGFTAGGLAEIQRPRIHPPLHELLAGPHAAGLRALRRIAASAEPGRPPQLRAAPDVVTALQTDPCALPDLVRRLGQPILLRADPALPPGATVIEDRPHG